MAHSTTTAVATAAPVSTRKPRHLLSLSTEEKREFFDSFDNIYSDIDGVVWNVHSRIPNGPETFIALEATGKKIHFITNNSLRPEAACLASFQKVKMNVQKDQIIHPAKSVVAFLKQRNFDGLIYIVGSKHFKQVVRDGGFTVIDGPDILIDDDFHELAHHVFSTEPVRAVIMDADFNMNTMKVMKADLYARHPDCLLIAGATDLLLPVHPTINLLGPGYFTKVVADASGKEPIVLGKPGKGLAELLCQQQQLQNPQRSLMIGDMLEQDIGLGKECGFQTLAVLTGATKLPDLEAATKYAPDYYVDSIADFLLLLKDLNKLNL